MASQNCKCSTSQANLRELLLSCGVGFIKYNFYNVHIRSLFYVVYRFDAMTIHLSSTWKPWTIEGWRRTDTAPNDGALLRVLNAHAIILAEQEPMPPNLVTAFKKLQQAAERFRPASSIRESSSPLREAYETVWEELNKHPELRQMLAARFPIIQNWIQPSEKKY